MRRTKEWWARLFAPERSCVVYFERHQNSGGYSSYYPDDCTECGICGCPTLGSGPCSLCSKQYDALIRKANGDDEIVIVKKREAEL